MFMSVLRISLDSLTFTSIPFLQMERMGHSGTGPFRGLGTCPYTARTASSACDEAHPLGRWGTRPDNGDQWPR